MKNLILTLIFISLNTYAFCQENISNDTIVKIEVYILDKNIIPSFPYNPERIRKSDRIIFKIELKNRNSFMNEIASEIFINTKKIKTGKIYEDQLSDGRILIDLFCIDNLNKSQKKYSVFIDFNGNYLINNQNEEFKFEKEIIYFINKSFPFLGKNYFKLL